MSYDRSQSKKKCKRMSPSVYLKLSDCDSSGFVAVMLLKLLKLASDCLLKRNEGLEMKRMPFPVKNMALVRKASINCDDPIIILLFYSAFN